MSHDGKDNCSVDQAPKWFDLAKYESSKTANMHQWAYNLWARSSVLEQLQTTEQLNDDVIKLIEEFQDHGFIKQDIIPKRFGNITPLTTLDVQALNMAQSTQTMAGNIDDLDGYKETFKSTRHLKINFNAPLQSIKDEFDDWINYEKKLFDELFLKEKSIKKKKFYFKSEISDAKTRQWINLEVLPYLDLLIWMKHEKKYVKSFVLGQWLFENDINGTDLSERVRGSTKPQAEMISSPEFVEFFINQLSPNTQEKKIEMEERFYNTINNWFDEEDS